MFHDGEVGRRRRRWWRRPCPGRAAPTRTTAWKVAIVGSIMRKVCSESFTDLGLTGDLLHSYQPFAFCVNTCIEVLTVPRVSHPDRRPTSSDRRRKGSSHRVEAITDHLPTRRDKVVGITIHIVGQITSHQLCPRLHDITRIVEWRVDRIRDSPSVQCRARGHVRCSRALLPA